MENFLERNPPAYRPVAMFSSAFFKIFIVLPLIRPSNNTALSTIREGFSTFHVPISTLHPLRIRPRPRTGCTRPLVFQYPSRRGGNRGMKLKKTVYQLLDDTGRVDVGGFSCFALHRSRFRMLNRGGSLCGMYGG